MFAIYIVNFLALHDYTHNGNKTVGFIKRFTNIFENSISV